MSSAPASTSTAFQLLRRPQGFKCKPILIIGLPVSESWCKYLSNILIHDLLYSSTSTYNIPSTVEDAYKALSSLDGKKLLQLCRQHGGTVFWDGDSQDDDDSDKRLRELEKGEYQAVIVSDAFFIDDPSTASFVMKQYAEKGSSVVILGYMGIFNLSAVNRSFNVNWKLVAYTTRSIKLTDIGKEIIGDDAFPFAHQYVKSNFVVGGKEIFTEYQHPGDYDDEEDYPDGPPPPKKGSPVVTAFDGNKSVSYFGFVNPLDVPYDDILLKLCYAAQQEGETKGSSKKTSSKPLKSTRPGGGIKKSITGPVLMAVAILSVLAAYLFQKKIVDPPAKQWARGTTGNLLGEVHIKNKDDAIQFANKAIAEGFGIWDEPSSNFDVMYNSSSETQAETPDHTKAEAKPELLVEARRITEGPFKTSGILLTRSTGFIAGSDPDEIYNHLISPEGIQILDETMDPAEKAKYIERYEWKGFGRDARLDVHESFNPMPPGIKDRYHIVLNGYYTKERLFFCKSIVHDSRPGSSPYYDLATSKEDATTISEANNNDERVRAINTFYFHMAADKDKGGTVVRMVNYADFSMGSTVMNWLVGKAFYPGVYDRLYTKFHNTNKRQ